MMVAPKIVNPVANELPAIPEVNDNLGIRPHLYAAILNMQAFVEHFRQYNALIPDSDNIEERLQSITAMSQAASQAANSIYEASMVIRDLEIPSEVNSYISVLMRRSQDMTDFCDLQRDIVEAEILGMRSNNGLNP